MAPLLASGAVSAWYILAAVGLLFTGAGGTGILLGQFRKGVVSELRESLETAQTEIAINRGIVNRLEVDMKKMEGRCEHLEAENRALRTAVETGAALVPFMREELDKFEIRILARHRILAQSLPEPIKTALIDSLGPTH